MENSMTTTQVGLRYGLIFGIIGIIYNLILQFAGLAGNQAASWAGMIITVVGLVLAHKAFKDSGDGYMKYGQGMSISFILLVVSNVLGSAFLYIYLSFVDDSMLQMIKEKTYEQWEAQGMSDAAMAQAESIGSFFWSVGGVVTMGVVGGLIVGLIVALIVTAITKNTPPETDIA